MNIQARNKVPATTNPAPGGMRVPRFTFHVSRLAAFTMIEIALSLAVIAFALVAIIGVLPIGMNVQRDNRQETIINQEASIWMDGIRNGERGLDDLTNYVTAITNYADLYRNGKFISHQYREYTYTSASLNGSANNQLFPITNGFLIVGLLSTPKITDLNVVNSSFTSNHVVAWVRSMSGPASEKAPQNNSAAQDLGLSYKLITEVVRYGTNSFYPSWTNFAIFPANSVAWTNGLNYFKMVTNLQNMSSELRLTFRWPLKPNGDTGPGRQIFRTTVGGTILSTNQNGFPVGISNYYFFQPRAYAKGS